MNGRRADRPQRVTRDLALFIAATGLFAFEIVIGGGRAAVLTACVSLLISPLVMRVDEARKDKAEPKDEQ